MTTTKKTELAEQDPEALALAESRRLRIKRLNLAKAREVLHATHDGVALTKKARGLAESKLNQALCAKYNLDPLAPGYAKRLKHARSAYFRELGLESAKRRWANRGEN